MWCAFAFSAMFSPLGGTKPTPENPYLFFACIKTHSTYWEKTHMSSSMNLHYVAGFRLDFVILNIHSSDMYNIANLCLILLNYIRIYAVYF